MAVQEVSNWIANSTQQLKESGTLDVILNPDIKKDTDDKIAAINESSSPFVKDKHRLEDIFSRELNPYKNTFYDNSLVDVEIPRGAEDFENDVKAGIKRLSAINKIHVIKLNGIPSSEDNIKNSNFIDNYLPKTAVDLCQTAKGMVVYDIEDFLYCKWLGVPINRLITLRRFPRPCIDNIFTLNRTAKWKDKDGKMQTDVEKTNDTGDIARMVTYMTAETNKVEDILSISYALKWKQLTADYEQASMFGEQSGVSGWIKSVAAIFDSTTNSNYLSGRSTGGPMASYDPKFDQNRVYGPVDSINETNIRDVGLEFSKEFEITFDYELRSINGRTPEYAMKDILANVLACTFNNGKFWPGARYWVGERPSPWAKKLQWMNADNIDTVFKGMVNMVMSGITQFFGNPKESSLAILKKAVKGSLGVVMGKLLDGLGRPGIPAMNSLLSSEPTGEWHLMVGNPHNPILSIGNLICTGTDIKFPTDAFSYGDFPTKMQVIVKLKPGMPKDRAQIETMFNHGMNKMYWQPTKQEIVKRNDNTLPLVRTGKGVNGELTNLDVSRQLQNAYDFVPYSDNSATALKNPTISINNENATVEGSLYDEYKQNSLSSDKKTEEVKNNSDIKTDVNQNQNNQDSNQNNRDIPLNYLKQVIPGQVTINTENNK